MHKTKVHRWTRTSNLSNNSVTTIPLCHWCINEWTRMTMRTNAKFWTNFEMAYWKVLVYRTFHGPTFQRKRSADKKLELHIRSTMKESKIVCPPLEDSNCSPIAWAVESDTTEPQRRHSKKIFEVLLLRVQRAVNKSKEIASIFCSLKAKLKRPETIQFNKRLRQFEVPQSKTKLHS